MKTANDHPEIFKQLMAVSFVVKQLNGSFNAAFPDMKLEESIQKSQKSARGIIVQTRKVQHVSE